MSALKQRTGFTIVELLVVIIVIAILASVAIVGYGAWRTKIATDATKSDLTQVYSVMQNARTFSETGYPTAIPATFQSSNNVLLSGGGRPGGKAFCIQGTFTDQPGVQYYISNKQASPTAGTCTITTTVLAGSSGASGYVNATGASATFTRIEGFSVADNGSVYAADGGHLRRATSGGVVTTYDGSGSDGFMSGTVGSDLFAGARGVAIDAAGNIYVIAINNNILFKITPTGVRTNHAINLHGTDVVLGSDNIFHVLEGDNYSGKLYRVTMAGTTSVVAGNATNASIDGQGTAASLHDPRAITRASDGTLYICDNGSGRVRKVTPTYYVSTYASSTATYPGGATSTIQGHCGGVAVDKNDILYVASGSKVQTIDKDGTVTDFATTAGSVSSLGFDDNGDLYVSTGRVLYKINVP